MKRFSTITCCVALAIFGAFVGINNPSPLNTMSAETPIPMLEFPKDLCKLVHDTVTTTVRDTVYKTKYKTTTKYRKVVVKDTIKQEIPVLYTRTIDRHRPTNVDPDTLLAPTHKRVHREVIELNGED